MKKSILIAVALISLIGASGCSTVTDLSGGEYVIDKNGNRLLLNCGVELNEMYEKLLQSGFTVKQFNYKKEKLLDLIVVYNDVTFKKSSYKLTKESEVNLNNLLAIVKKSKKETQLNVVGHADMTGNKDYNLILSEQRAKVVSTYLYENGYPSNNITYTGASNYLPKDDRSLENAYFLNRRVSIEIKVENKDE